MTATRVADTQTERANLMYWTSAETVDGIAEQLGMSRSSLYSAVRPTEAGAHCPDCGDDLVFPNRTSRTAGRAVCLSCGRTAALDDLAARPPARNGWEDGPAEEAGGRPGWLPDGLRDGLAAVEPERAAMIGGAAVLGAVAGVAAINLLRRFH